MAKNKFIENLNSMINTKFIGYEINGDEGSITLQFDSGIIEVSGNDLEAYVELETLN